MTTTQEALKAAELALTENAKTFRWYEELHRAKPDHEKADRNKEFAERTEQALALIREAREGEGCIGTRYVHKDRRPGGGYALMEFSINGSVNSKAWVPIRMHRKAHCEQDGSIVSEYIYTDERVSYIDAGQIPLCETLPAASQSKEQVTE